MIRSCEGISPIGDDARAEFCGRVSAYRRRLPLAPGRISPAKTRTSSMDLPPCRCAEMRRYILTENGIDPDADSEPATRHSTPEQTQGRLIESDQQ